MKCYIKSLSYVAACGSLLTFMGCQKAAPPKPAPAASGEEHHEGDGHEHGHATEGPHHGHLIELGEEEYHAELTHDEGTHTIGIYLLDSAAKQSVGADEQEVTINVVAGGKPAQFTLAAKPQADDPAGQTSYFEIVDETLCEALDGANVKGRLNVKIGGKSYVGDLKHEPHGEHEHHEK